MYEKIRVLFVLPDLQGGGAERVLVTLLQSLDPARWEPTVLLFHKQGVFLDQVPPHVRVESVLGTRGRIRHAIPQLLWKAIAAARRTDVVVGQQELLPTYVAWAAARVARRPFVAWVHIALTRRLAASSSAAAQAFARRFYARLPRVVFPSDGARQDFIEWLGPTWPGQSQVIPNPINSSLFAAPPRIEQPQGEQVVAAAGRLDRQKGFDVLIRAHAMLRRRGARHRLVILGEGSERPALEQLVANLGVQDSVSMPGFQADLASALRCATVFVLSSRYEGFGMVLIEAMSQGVPVVATDCPSGPAEILRGGELGVLVPPEDETALAKAISALLGDTERRMRLGRLGIDAVKAYAPTQVAGMWERLFGEELGLCPSVPRVSAV